MKHLYLMRHGQTLFNAQNKIQGWCDSPLTSKGIEQAKAAKKILDERILTVGYIRFLRKKQFIMNRDVLL